MSISSLCSGWITRVVELEQLRRRQEAEEVARERAMCRDVDQCLLWCVLKEVYWRVEDILSVRGLEDVSEGVIRMRYFSLYRNDVRFQKAVMHKVGLCERILSFYPYFTAGDEPGLSVFEKTKFYQSLSPNIQKLAKKMFEEVIVPQGLLFGNGGLSSEVKTWLPLEN